MILLTYKVISKASNLKADRVTGLIDILQRMVTSEGFDPSSPDASDNMKALKGYISFQAWK